MGYLSEAGITPRLIGHDQGLTRALTLALARPLARALARALASALDSAFVRVLGDVYIRTIHVYTYRY